MNAVVFIAHAYPSGLVFHMAHLACAMQALYAAQPGTAFYVCSEGQEQFQGSWDLVRQQVPADRILIPTNYHGDVARTIRNLLARHGKVLVHCGGGRHQMAPLRALKREFRDRLTIVVTTHSYKNDRWTRPVVSFLQSLLYRACVDHVVFQCPYAARRFVGGEGFLRRNRASIIPLCVEPFPPAALRPEPVGALGEPDIGPLLRQDGLFNIVYLAFFHPGKKHRWFVDAFAPLLAEHRNARVFFLGRGTELETVRAHIRQRNLQDAILTPGMIERRYIPWVLGKCHCAAVSSRAETFGHCYAEPMAAGLPMVGTRVGIGEYLIQDYQTGIGFADGDTAGFRTAMRQVLQNRAAAAAMGQTAQEIATRLYSPTAVARAHVRLYDRLFED